MHQQFHVEKHDKTKKPEHAEHISSAQLILCTTVTALKNMTLDFEEKRISNSI